MYLHRRIVRQAHGLGLLVTLVVLAIIACGGKDEQQGRGPIPDAGGPQEATERRWWEFWR